MHAWIEIEGDAVRREADARLDPARCLPPSMSSPSDNPDNRLFVEVVQAMGLSPIFGPGTLRRALADVGSVPATARPETYLRALPHIEARMRAFLDETAVRVGVERVRALLREELERG
jgi:hypothetical protein